MRGHEALHALAPHFVSLPDKMTDHLPRAVLGRLVELADLSLAGNIGGFRLVAEY